MSLTLRRSHAADPARETELPQSIEVEALHALLHRRGEPDLAAALLLRLTSEGALDLAALLARFRRGYSRPGLFRSYTRLLDAAGARQVDLAVAFLRGAGQAGCRVYPDPANDARTINQTSPPPHLYALPRADEQADGGAPGAGGAGGERPRGLMPPWLPAPDGLSWDR